MSKLILNNIELEIDSFSHTISCNNGLNLNRASAQLKQLLPDNLIDNVITSLQVVNNSDVVVYNLQNIHAKIVSTNINLENEGLKINITIDFNMG